MVSLGTLVKETAVERSVQVLSKSAANAKQPARVAGYVVALTATRPTVMRAAVMIDVLVI
jgi:hypothetical protein